ncbi:hypothetical protein ACVJBD_000482 [Rhizobium mongolense]
MQPVTILLVDDDASVLQVFQHVPTTRDSRCTRYLTEGRPYTLSGRRRSAQARVDLRYPVGRRAGRLEGGSRCAKSRRGLLYTSGNNSAEWETKGLPNSIMLQKPFALAQLVTAISQLLNESSIPEESRAARLHPVELEKLELPQVASSHYQFSASAADASPGACVQLPGGWIMYLLQSPACVRDGGAFRSANSASNGH